MPLSDSVCRESFAFKYVSSSFTSSWVFSENRNNTRCYTSAKNAETNLIDCTMHSFWSLVNNNQYPQNIEDGVYGKKKIAFKSNTLHIFEGCLSIAEHYTLAD